MGSTHQRALKTIHRTVAKIEALAPQIAALKDAELTAKTQEFKLRLAQGETLDSLLPEAFAVVRETATRVLGQRHFPVQLIGGVVLHQGKIAEMRTGEGKTLVATLPSYLNALTGKGVHVVTANDYLAKRDAEWMGQIHQFLGLSVGAVISGITDAERKAAYAADITYCTNNELGFDYLRDQMRYNAKELVLRPFNFVIIDEVDAALIDEARTPLIISGPARDDTEVYQQADKIARKIPLELLEIDEKRKTVMLTEEGSSAAEQLCRKAGLMAEESSLYDLDQVELLHHLTQSLRAHYLFQKDRDYLIKDKSVVIVDEFTGRMMPGRRFGEGLHQALEAKEQVTIHRENQTLASTTLQNFFRQYPKLAGMGGTALTEATEFEEIYGLQVVPIPTNIPVARVDADDEVYKTIAEKNKAIISVIKEAHQKAQPVLVGTVTIEKSEHLSALLKKEKIPHQVLNARYHEQEAYIIAQAGRPYAVTIATNMAGRGTDIQLGGNIEMLLKQQSDSNMSPEEIQKLQARITTEVQEAKAQVIAAGGLMVIGTERHESRRIDDQLRGRAGRQGDIGFTQFYVSLEDDLMRIFGSGKIGNLLAKLGLKEGEAIQHPWLSKAIAKAQQKVESRNFEMRKTLLQFDNVLADQRQVIYEQRHALLEAEDLSNLIARLAKEQAEFVVSQFANPKTSSEEWALQELSSHLKQLYQVDLPKTQDYAELVDQLGEAIIAHITSKEEKYGSELYRNTERYIFLVTLDQLWKDHLLTLDHLRAGISLRAYGQKDPLNEYKREAFAMFGAMMDSYREQIIVRLSTFELREDQPIEEQAYPKHPAANMKMSRAPDPTIVQDNTPPLNSLSDSMPVAVGEKIGRNHPCPCGSGKKYKHCHGTF